MDMEGADGRHSEVLLVVGRGQFQCIGQAVGIAELLQQIHVDLGSIIDNGHHQRCDTC